jgi:hypothetical protein
MTVTVGLVGGLFPNIMHSNSTAQVVFAAPLIGSLDLDGSNCIVFQHLIDNRNVLSFEVDIFRLPL